LPVEPGEQLLGLAERFGGVVAGARRQRRASRRGVQLGELLPGGELAQQPGVVIVGAVGQALPGPSLRTA